MAGLYFVLVMERIRNYYYNKLTHDYKIVVKTLYKQLLQFNNVIEVKGAYSDLYSVFECLKYTFPELFYVDLYNIEYKVYINKTKIKFRFLYSKDEIDSCNIKINNIIAKININEPESKIVSRIYNTIISHVTYDSKDLVTTKSSNHDIYGAIMYRESVCEGMSLLFLHICNKVGIDCTVVTGNTSGPHMWNVVRIETVLVNIDIVMGISCLKNGIKYGGFNLPNYLMKGYQFDNLIDCCSLECNPYFYNDMVYENLGDLSNKIKYFLNKMNRVVLMYIGKEKLTIDDIVNGLGSFNYNIRFVLYNIYLIVEKE